jgi:hypothetical protein
VKEDELQSRTERYSQTVDNGTVPTVSEEPEIDDDTTPYDAMIALTDDIFDGESNNAVLSDAPPTKMSLKDIRLKGKQKCGEEYVPKVQSYPASENENSFVSVATRAQNAPSNGSVSEEPLKRKIYSQKDIVALLWMRTTTRRQDEFFDYEKQK